MSIRFWLLAGLAGLFGAAPAWCEQGPWSARGRRGMVASSDAIATKVGVDILRRGGNAIDAAVAVGLALAVTYPQAGNLGGGGFMLLRMADGRTTAIDYRETAPAAADRDMYVGEDGSVIPEASLVGYRAAGIPGTVAGLDLALRKYGTMKWAEVVEPALRLAAEGFSICETLAADLRDCETLGRFPESRRIFLNAGKYFAPGDILRQPELAATLRRLRKGGAREFYEGRTAELIAEDMKENGGLITQADLKGYRPIERPALRATYRGCVVVTFPPPSSGGVALIEMLNMLEPFDPGARSPGSAAGAHLLIEVMRRAFADRAEFMGDPSFVTMPIAGLISKRYAADLVAGIDPGRAGDSEMMGPGNPVAYEPSQTTHFSVVDAAGNAVSNTYTLNESFGCGVTVRGAGFLLNNEMDDFTSKPGEPNTYGLIQGEANAIAPGKRPLSSMTPTMLIRDGHLVLIIGSPGGPRIVNTVLQVILNFVDHGMSIPDAIEAPRIHHQWWPDSIEYEPAALSPAVMDRLRHMGHAFQDRPRGIGDAQGIALDPRTGERTGASDTRSGSGAAMAE